MLRPLTPGPSSPSTGERGEIWRLRMRNQASWLGCMLAIPLCASIASAQGGKQFSAKEYREPFKGAPANPDDFTFFGPEANEFVKYEPQGLRITLPGAAKPRPNTGLQSKFGIKGDFELTLRYELLTEPKVQTAMQSRFTIGIT